MRTYRTDHRNPQRLRYGWRLTRSGHIVVDPGQRASIFVMLALREERATLQQICDHLSSVQSPTPRKGRWHCSTVKKIIDQNRALMSLLPHTNPGAGMPRARPSVAQTSDANDAVSQSGVGARDSGRAPARDAAYAPSRRSPAGALVHKSTSHSQARG